MSFIKKFLENCDNKKIKEQIDHIDESQEMEDDPCWDGYKMVGKKTKNGKEVPNCVPED